MKYTLVIYRGKILVITIMSLILTLFPLVIFFSINYLNAFATVIGILLILPLSIIVGLSLSKKTVEIFLDEIKIIFENIDIQLVDLTGYYINRQSPILAQVEFKDIDNKDYRFTSLKFGKNGREFESFLSEFLKKTQVANNQFSELSFYDFHQSQYKFSRVFIYVMMVMTILLNLVYLYLILFKHFAFNWKLLFINFIFLGLYNFHKENEKKYKNRKTTAMCASQK